MSNGIPVRRSFCFAIGVMYGTHSKIDFVTLLVFAFDEESQGCSKLKNLMVGSGSLFGKNMNGRDLGPSAVFGNCLTRPRLETGTSSIPRLRYRAGRSGECVASFRRCSG